MVMKQVKDRRGNNFVIYWDKAVLFDDGKAKNTSCFKVGHGDSNLTEEQAFTMAWQYFRELVDRAPTDRGAHGVGLMGEIEDDGKRYHGTTGDHIFTRWPGAKRQRP